MSTTSLLHPSEARVRAIVSQTAHAFRVGPKIHPSRAAYEFYPTPPEATLALLAAETFDGSIWEPACGEGHIAKVLEAHGHAVTSTDLANWGYGQSGRDFLQERRPLAKHIITNPPYGKGLADAFVAHALRMTQQTGGDVAMLLNITGLCHPMRHAFWLNHKPSVIYALDQCQCWPYGDKSKATTAIGKQRYCWLVWKHGHNGDTVFKWLSTAPYRQRQLT